MKKLAFITITLALFWSCKKRDYPPDQVYTGPEKFYFDALVDNEPVALKAGQDGYYYETSVVQDDSLYTFIGELKKKNCNPCPKSLRVEIADYRKSGPGSGSTPDSVFGTGNLAFAKPLLYSPSFTFSPSFNRNATQWFWNFGDGTTSASTIPQHTYSRAGKYKVSVTITSNLNCVNTVSNTLHIFDDGKYFFSAINQAPTGPKSAAFTSAVQGGRAPHTYQWHFGDGSTSDAANPGHEYEWPGGYPVKLVVTDADGNQVISEYNYVTGNDQSSCGANFSVAHHLTTNALFKTVKLAWTDGSGKVFRTDLAAQPATSHFQVISAEEFDKNKAADPTRLLTVRIDALVSDGHETKRVTCEKAVLGVAYK